MGFFLPLVPLTADSWRTADLAWAFSSRFRVVPDAMDDFDASEGFLRTGLGLMKGSYYLLTLRGKGCSNETAPAVFEERGGGSVLAGT